MNQINWNRTDLVDEAEEVVSHRTKQEKEILKESDVIKFHEEMKQRVKITTVTVSAEGEKTIGKKEGKYITLTVPTLHVDDEQGIKQIEQHLFHALHSIHKGIKLSAEDKILIIGLGNKMITPDAVGPIAIDLLQKENATYQFENIYLYAPGVTAQTGYETSDFVRAIAEKINPSLVIVIDALATRATERLCRTIQLTNTGIHPGSGVGNERKEISKESIGIPVTAIGIPTVVGGPVLVSDAVDRVIKKVAMKIQEKSKPSGKLSVAPINAIDENVNVSVTSTVFGEWVNWTKEEREQLFTELLSSNVETVIVTPKEIDTWIDIYAKLLMNSLLRFIQKKRNYSTKSSK